MKKASKRRQSKIRNIKGSTNHPQEVGPDLESLLEREKEKLRACPVKNYTRAYIKEGYLKEGIELSRREIAHWHKVHRNWVEIRSKWGYIICAHSIIEQGLKGVLRMSGTLTPKERNADGSHKLDVILDALDERNPDVRISLRRTHDAYRRSNPEHRRLIPADFNKSIKEITITANNLRYIYLEGDLSRTGELLPCIVIEHLHALADTAADAGEAKYMIDRALAQIRMGIWDQYGDKYKRMRLRMEKEEKENSEK